MKQREDGNRNRHREREKRDKERRSNLKMRNIKGKTMKHIYIREAINMQSHIKGKVEKERNIKASQDIYQEQEKAIYIPRKIHMQNNRRRHSNKETDERYIKQLSTARIKELSSKRGEIQRDKGNIK